METENKYKYARAYYKILELITNNPNENIFVIRGGQGAAKTISVLQLVIQALVSSEKEATVLSDELSKMKRTVIRDYKKICRDWGVIHNETDFNKSESKHEYSNDSYLDFLGADVVDVGKGFRRDILYINEANKISIETAIQFISRAKLTIIDYNPDEVFWGDEFINEKNFITLTFKDNEFLSEAEVKSIYEYKDKGFYNPELPDDKLFDEGNIKSKYWANKWRVYGLGLVGSLDGIIFDDWAECFEIPKGAELIGNGMDFGFTQDPTTLIKVFRFNGELYVDELIYQTGLTNSDIIGKLKALGISSSEKIIADSAEPKSIEDLKRGGFNAEGALKGADSIRNSIDILKRFKINITKRSTNTIREMKGFTWKTMEDNNHTIDAIRYVALNRLRENYAFNYRIRSS